MAYKKDDNGGQAATSAAPASSSSGSSNQSFGGNYSQGGGRGKSSAKSSVGSRDSSAHAAASADRAAAAKRGKVTAFTPSVRGGVSSKPGASFSPAYVGKNPYQWGNNEGVVNHWHDDDPERQTKLDALAFSADDPDRSFHYYEPDKGSDKSYLERANSLNIDRNFFQAGNFWNTIDGPYDSEDARKSDAAQWMLDAQTYGKWAREHNLTYTDENGNTRNMEDAWKDIWDYANEITGGLGDSESTRAQKDIQSYLTGGEYSSEQTKQLLEQARQFSENAESEKDAKLWSELEQSLNIQLKDDEKREKREGTFLGKASDFFAAPEKEQVEYTPEEQKGRETLEGEYNRLKAQYQEASAYATDPAQLQELDGMKAQLDALEQQIKDDNRAHGREVYDGLGADTRAADAFEGWAGGRAANVGAVAGTILNWVDSASDDMVRYEYDQEHGEGAWDRAVKANPELENYLDLEETGNRLMEGAQANKVASDQLWSDYQEDMSDFGKLRSNVVRGGADLALNAAENAFVPGSGAFSMYMQAAGGGALEQAGRENNDPDSVAAAAVVRGVGAWFSNRLVGGVEAVYGKSVLGGIADNLIKGASPAAQKTIKTLLNSEGIEEGLEDMLNYAADRILGLDGDASLDWNEVKQDAMIGYILGVLTNGLAGGMNYDQAARHRIVDGGIEAAESGLAPQKIERIARESTKEDVVIKPGNAETSQETENVTSQDTGVSSQVTPEQAAEMAQSQTAALEGQGTSPQAAPANQEQQNRTLSEAQAAALEAQNENVAPAPEQQTNPAVNEEQAQAMSESQNAAIEGQEQNPAPAPQQEDFAARMETGDVSEDEILDRMETEEGRQELADILGLPNNDVNTVSDGLQLYIILQNQLQQMQGQQNEARSPQYGEEGFVNPMGEDIEEDEGSSPVDESVDEDEDLPPLEDLLAEMAEEEGKAPAQQNQDTAGMLLGEEAETNSIPPAPDNPEHGAGKTQTWHDLKNVVTDSPNAAITSSNSEYGTSYTVYSHDENGNTSFRPFDSYAEAKAYYDYLNGNPSSYTEDVFTGWGTQAAQETSQNAQGNPEGVNSQAEETNSNTGVLNAQETAGNANPEQNTQNNPPKREKISQYFLNTLTESGRAEGLDPVTYNPTSEAESLTNAAMKLAADKQAVLDRLMSSPAWNGELTDAAWLIENEFLKEFRATKDRTSWDAWRKLETYKISETAKGLQAVAKQSRPGAAGVLEASLNLLEDFKKKGAKQNQTVSQQEVTKAEKGVTDVAYRMAEIENEIDQRTEGGMDETEARAMSKEDYLDLAEKINQIRNTGKMFFGGKKKFRNMLGSQDMDFIQRFVACQAAGIAEDVNYKGKQDRLKQLNTFQKLAQLTGTGTWSRNLQGNATFGLIDLLANNGVAVAVDQIVSKATGQRSTGFELGALSMDARSAAKRALDRSILEVAANIDLAENSAMEGYDLSRTRTFDPNGNIVERVLSRWEQWNGYMLNSSDKFFRGGAARSSADAIRRANARNGYNVNDADVQQTADQVAAYRLFQNNGVAAEAADSIREGLNRLGAKAVGRTYERGQFGLGTALTPYTKVPTNIGVKALEFSPAGAAKGFAEIVRTARDAKAGKATMAQQNQAVTDFARGVTGTALIVGLAQLMKGMPFFKDWENEEDKDVKAQNRAEGKSGMQFNIDMMLRAADGDEDPTWRNSDRTIDISSIEPANQLMTAASLISEGMPAGQAILQSAKENFMGLPSVSALKNIEDTIRYTDTPDDLSRTLLNTAASTAGGVASGFIPAPIRHATTVSDEYARDTSGSNATERAVNQFKASVPGLRETLPVKTDNFGNEISAGSLGTRLLNTYGGNKYTEINQSELSREAERLREATGEQLIPSRNGPSSEKFGDEKVKFTAGERKDWKDEYGQDLGDAVGMLMRSSIYKDADDDLKAELWKNLEGYAKDGVKAEYADDHDLQYDSKYDYLDGMDNPITFLTASKAFSIAQSKDDYDIVDTLIGPVARLSPEEQDLMRDKNSTLMNYYDYLTPNDRGYKVKDAETVRQFKKDAKANAEARGKTSASGQDKFSSVYNGYLDRAFTDEDVDAIMSKSKTTEDEETGDTTVTWDITKGRAAIYLAMRAGGASVLEALDAVRNADVDYDNTIDEKGIKIKAEYEGTNALKRYGSGNDAMWYEFNEIMYPYKNQR